eukprot:CAMPEP_0172195500 /NCGR_PEP_ID=MMETSP1050-20130122/26244_1 /TAXON_ID=233186 /ORGANISM="Cryptomonas curvata, Strain CCAP979/52" /LENGTH=112 /DNA_ID=CAMNT_0012871573 /DNA_START=130 /DNA_END=464 /DNA_ORIENTATION=+
MPPASISAGEASAARARLVGTVRRFRNSERLNSSYSDDGDGDPAAERWGLPVSEAMAFLKGVNTVGAVFVFLSLLLMLAAAAGEAYGEASQDMQQVAAGIGKRARYTVTQTG